LGERAKLEADSKFKMTRLPGEFLQAQLEN
jgi:hypothetical protein